MLVVCALRPLLSPTWLIYAFVVSVWHVDGADAKRGRGWPPKGFPSPPEKPKEGAKPGVKPVLTASQCGSRVFAAEKEAHERRRAYLEQLHARGVSGETFKVATQAYDDAHRLKLPRASSSVSTVDAGALNDDDDGGFEFEEETESAHRRPLRRQLPLSTSPPAPGHAPPRMISPSSSFNRDRLLADEMYAPELLRYTFVMEPPVERAATPKAEERVSPFPRTLARREGPSLGSAFPLSQARETFVCASEGSIDEMTESALPACKMPSMNKRKRPS